MLPPVNDAPSTPSRPLRVTLFEDRAEVTRAADIDLPAGTGWAAIGGVSPFVDERSVQARLVTETNGDGAPKGGARVLSARVVRRAHLEKELGRAQIEALEAEAREARAALVEIGQAKSRAARAEARANALGAKWIEGVAAVPRGAREPDRIASFRDALAAIERATADALAAAAAAREAEVKRGDELARTEARLAEGSVERPRHEARIEVEIDAPSPARVMVEVTYRVPSALWRPEHLVRLAAPPPAQGEAAPVEITTFATAWQRTGEVWDDVEVRFSTARPARAASPPALADDVLASRRKTDQERSRVVVDARNQAVQAAGLGRGTRAVEEMLGVDDGGEPVVFAPRGRVSIASDGRPFRVEVARATVDAKIERVLFPEVAHEAHLRATATLAKGGPILAGPLRIARGKSLVGRAKIGYVGKGDTFEVGLGPDDGVRVRREQTEERETVSVIGTQKIRRKVSVYLSNLGSDPRRVLVTERVPVSEIEEVEITVLDAGGFRHDPKDGFLRREIDLGPQATAVLELAYEIRAASKVVLPF
jgi:uncharacterized protein (TIGR02231 family)